jgi:MoaA/NifB/PqqE/SkfB family radical SAM enzyme
MLRNLRNFFGKHLVMIVTRKCNLKCEYCNVINQKYEDIQFKQWKKEIDCFNKFNITHISLQGGEPTEYKDLFKVIKYIKSKSKATISIVTNGIKSIKDPIYRKKLSLIGIDSITVSINKKTRIKEIKEISDEFKIVIINTIISSENVLEIPKIIEEISKCKNCFSNLIIIQKEQNLFSKKENIKKIPSKKDIKKLSKKLINLKLKGYPILTSFEYLKRMNLYVEGINWKCKNNAFNKFFALNNDGQIMVCQGTKPTGFFLSNLNRKNKREFKIKIKEITKGCKGCIYDCSFNSSTNKIIKFLEYCLMLPRLIKKKWAPLKKS